MASILCGHGGLLRIGICAASIAVSACGSGSGDDDATCSPGPRIISTPNPDANVGIQYAYFVDASYSCGFLFTCDGIDLIAGPPGAGVDTIRDVVYWTPDASQANTDMQFQIATQPDDCDDRAFQSWSVHVNP